MKTSFTVRLYRPGLGTAEAAQMEVCDGRIRLSPGGDVLALAQVDIKLGGHSDDKVKLTDRESGLTLVCDSHELLSALASAADDPAMRARLTRLSRDGRMMPFRRAAYWASVCLLILVSLFVLLAGTEALEELTTNSIDPQTEHEIGKRLIDQEKFESISPRAKRVSAIGGRLVKRLADSRYTFKFLVRESDDINAFAYPGGYIVVCSGLIERASGDDEVACVLAHEIAHTLNRDVLKGMVHKLSLLACLSILTGSGSAVFRDNAEVLAAARSLEEKSYGRGQEAEADREGVGIAYRAGFNAEAFIAFFERLQALEPAGDSKLFAFVSDHPMDSERIALIRRELARLKAQGSQLPAGR